MAKAAVIAMMLWAGSAHADTLGLFPCTQHVQHWESATPKGGAAFIVVRDAGTWATVWKQAGMQIAPPVVDFAHEMVVGIVTGPNVDREIYRIEIDNVAAPKALMVRTALGGAPCRTTRMPASTREQLVVTPRSLLPVTWVNDGMIDGGMYSNRNEGVETTILGVENQPAIAVATKAAPPPPQMPGPPSARGPGCCKPAEIVTTREAAEARVLAQLTAAEIAKLSVGPVGRPMARIPHGWTKLAVAYAAGTWTVAYDDLTFTVDANTGHVTR